MFEGCLMILEVWTIWRPPEADKKIRDRFFKVSLIIECGVSKDAQSKLLKGCAIKLEVWTIRRPLEAV